MAHAFGVVKPPVEPERAVNPPSASPRPRRTPPPEEKPQVGDKLTYICNLPTEHVRGLELEAEVMEVGGPDGLTLKIRTHLPGGVYHKNERRWELHYTNHSEDIISDVRPLSERKASENARLLPWNHKDVDHSNGYWAW